MWITGGDRGSGGQPIGAHDQVRLREWPVSEVGEMVSQVAAELGGGKVIVGCFELRE